MIIWDAQLELITFQIESQLWISLFNDQTHIVFIWIFIFASDFGNCEQNRFFRIQMQRSVTAIRRTECEREYQRRNANKVHGTTKRPLRWMLLADLLPFTCTHRTHTHARDPSAHVYGERSLPIATICCFVSRLSYVPMFVSYLVVCSSLNEHIRVWGWTCT